MVVSHGLQRPWLALLLCSCGKVEDSQDSCFSREFLLLPKGVSSPLSQGRVQQLNVINRKEIRSFSLVSLMLNTFYLKILNEATRATGRVSQDKMLLLGPNFLFNAPSSVVAEISVSLSQRPSGPSPLGLHSRPGPACQVRAQCSKEASRAVGSVSCVSLQDGDEQRGP